MNMKHYRTPERIVMCRGSCPSRRRSLWTTSCARSQLLTAEAVSTATWALGNMSQGTSRSVISAGGAKRAGEVVKSKTGIPHEVLCI